MTLVKKNKKKSFFLFDLSILIFRGYKLKTQVFSIFLFIIFPLPAFSQEIDPSVIPFLLQEDHPAKKALDKIFSSKERILHTKETLKEIGGFKHIKQRTINSILVAKHKTISGYLIKTFLDTQAGNELENYLKRIEGALAIKKAIKKYHLESHFQVPEKWIYVIPELPKAYDGTFPKKYLLVVEDMHIFPPEANQTIWLSNAVTKKKLDGLYQLLNEVGLFDSVYISNIPFSLNKKISFIDTEHHHNWPVQFDKLFRFLSIPMQHYWSDLIIQGGP